MGDRALGQTPSRDWLDEAVETLANGIFYFAALIFVLACFSLAGVIALGCIIWLQRAEWPNWFLWMWVQEPTFPQLAGVQKMIDWVWTQPIQTPIIILGIALPIVIALVGVGFMKMLPTRQ